MLVNIWSKLAERPSKWIIMIHLNGPLNTEGSLDNYADSKIKFIYEIRKEDRLTRIMMLAFVDNIEYFYTKLCDCHPDRYRNLFEYSFNHNLGLTKNCVWMYSHIYWGTTDPGRVKSLNRMPRRAIITVATDYENLEGIEWNITSSSSDANSSHNSAR